MGKRIIAAILVCLLCLQVLPSGVFAAETSGNCGDNLTWTLENGTLTISGTGAMVNYASAEAPWYTNRENISSVQIGEGVTEIGRFAFQNCRNLAQVSLPNTLRKIGISAFSVCKSLTSVHLPRSLTYIANSAFNGSGLTSVTLPDNLTNLGDNVFADCKSLTEISIGTRITTIGANIFYNTKIQTVRYHGLKTDWESSGLPGQFAGMTVTVHATEAVAKQPASCDKTGMEAHYRCVACDELYRDPSGVTPVNKESLTIPYAHDMLEVPEKAATETEPGTKAHFQCKLCDRLFADEAGAQSTTMDALTIPPLGKKHTMNYVPGKEPSCTQDGYKEYYSCTVCGKMFSDKAGNGELTTIPTISATGHNMRKTPALEPTYDTDGTYGYFTCQTCGGVYCDNAGTQKTTIEARRIPALREVHQLTRISEKPATCAEGGWIEHYTCSHCEKLFADETGKQELPAEEVYLSALGHDLAAVPEKAPGCIKAGNSAYYRCNRCDALFADMACTQPTTWEAVFVEPTGHDMLRTKAKTPTCTEPGNNDYFTCSKCGITYKDRGGNVETTPEAEVLPPKGHAPGEIKPANYDAHLGGYTEDYSYCKRCSAVVNESGIELTETPPTQKAHIPGEVAHPGYVTPCGGGISETWYYCTLCGEKTDGAGNTVTATDGADSGHLPGTERHPATQEPGGYRVVWYDCVRCGRSVDEDGTPIADIYYNAHEAHNLDGVWHPADYSPCTGGVMDKYQQCADCGERFADKNLTPAQRYPAFHELSHIPEQAADKTHSGNHAYYRCKLCGKEFADEHAWEETTALSQRIPPEEPEVCLPELAGKDVFLDGESYTVDEDGFLTVGNGTCRVITTVDYTGTSEEHIRYPVGMQVWMVYGDDAETRAVRIPELDNILQYAGCSIRITGKKGIRMITAIDSGKKAALTGSGLAGFTLVEYGTLVAETGKLGNHPLVLGASGVRSNYAYKRGVADPVFQAQNGTMQYTNVLVGFTMDQCAEDLAMRPYMILEDENHNRCTIYGGTVYRSIGYIAYQNRNVFQNGSAAYNYVWDIIHHVYGDQYNGK